MNVEIIATIGISFLSLLLMINAFFTRETLLRVVKLEVMIQQNSTKQEYIERQSNDDHREILKLRDRVHTLEGMSVTIIDYMNNNSKQ